MTEPISDKDFLRLKVSYYKDGHRSDLPQVTTGRERPGGANNREQNALRWGYDQALRDIQEHIFETLFRRPSNG